MIRAVFTSMLMMLMFVLAGCATYEFDVTGPAELATHVGRRQDTVLPREPLAYILRAVENRLVMNIENRTDDPIQLMGEQSTVVDPNGQSHPLRSQTIAPSSFAKLILPPLRPVIRSGPTFGIGVGTYVSDGRRGYYDNGFHDHWHGEPQYFTVIDDDAIYWDWRGEGEIRLRLVFQRQGTSGGSNGNSAPATSAAAGENITHEFVIRRVKV